jgi:hypothetical protein
MKTDTDVDTLIQYGDLYGMKRFNAGMKEVGRIIDEF